MKALPLIFFTIGCAATLLAQTFGGHPPGLNWQQINTPIVRVIFPDGMETQAQRTANLLHFMHQKNLRSVGDRTKKVDVVLQNQTVIPNGFVAWAPFRSEFFLTPPQDPSLLGSLDWLDVLAVHEYRHVLQATNADRGLTRFFHYFMGDYGWAAMANLSIPSWFWEGDAVLAETALTSAGRGRLPSFSLEQRALLLDERRYSYMKARNGSMKDILPNHYPLGYVLCAFGRAQFGNDFWKEVLHDAGAYRSLLYPFSRALKVRTGLSTRQLYRETYQALEKQWKAEQDTLPKTEFATINKAVKRKPTFYNFPHSLSDGNLVCLKRSFDKITHLVAVTPEGEEKMLTAQGIVVDDYISENGDKIAWSEVQPDIRWGNQYYSGIVTFDYKTGEKRRLPTVDGEGSRYFSPCFSHDGSKIAAVQVTENQMSALHILDARTGEVLQKVPNPGNHFLMYPQWTDDDKALIFIDKQEGKMALFRQLLAEGASPVPLSAYTSHVLNTPHVAGERIFFSASFTGIDNIFQLSLNSTQGTAETGIFQVTSVPAGAYQPSISEDGKVLYFSNFTSMGHDLAKITSTPVNVQPVVIQEPVELFPASFAGAEGGDILPKIPGEKFPVENYNRLRHALHLHSWLLGSEPRNPALTSIFTNILNDTWLTLSAGWNLNENSPSATVDLAYGGWLPVLHLQGGVSGREVNFEGDGMDALNFTEKRIGGGVSLPLQAWHDTYFGSLNLSALAHFRQVKNFKLDTLPANRPALDFGNFDLGFSFSHMRKTAQQHIFPRFGQAIFANYERGLDRSDIGRIRLRTRLYFPGIFNTHSIELEGDFQKENLANAFQFGDEFEYARGYDLPLNDHVWRVGLNYHFPVAYPDWGFGGILYCLRLRSNLFYDHSQFSLEGFNFKQRSAGGELIFDTQWLNLPVLIPIGARYSYLLDEDDGVISIFFGAAF